MNTTTLLQDSCYLKAGTILMPKPEWKGFYDELGLYQYTVTKEDESKNPTIGERWMIKYEPN